MDAVPGAPWWVTVAVAVTAMLIGNIVKPMFASNDERRRLDAETSDKLRDDLREEIDAARKYLGQVQAESEVVRTENQRLFAELSRLAARWNEFQMTMLRETISVSIMLDTKDYASASARLDSLIKHIRSLQISEWGENGLS